MAIEQKVVVKELPKKGNFETLNVYVLGVPVFYASVHSPKDKYQSHEKEFTLTAFVNEAIKDELLDVVMLNKTFALVGKDKTTKPPRRIKYPLSSQTEEGNSNYDLVDGLYGFTVGKNALSKQGNEMWVNVKGMDGEDFKEDIGNGSICNIKMFGYKNQEGQVVVSLDTVQVVEHVPFEGGKGKGGSTYDEVLGVTYTKREQSQKQEHSVEEHHKSTTSQDTTQQDFDDDDIPF